MQAETKLEILIGFPTSLPRSKEWLMCAVEGKDTHVDS